LTDFLFDSVVRADEGAVSVRFIVCGDIAVAGVLASKNKDLFYVSFLF
jgi:hypothetical protein